ncbi:unnamed protein product, partial [Mycena citricolor]
RGPKHRRSRASCRSDPHPAHCAPASPTALPPHELWPPSAPHRAPPVPGPRRPCGGLSTPSHPPQNRTGRGLPRCSSCGASRPREGTARIGKCPARKCAPSRFSCILPGHGCAECRPIAGQYEQPRVSAGGPQGSEDPPL